MKAGKCYSWMILAVLIVVFQVCGGVWADEELYHGSEMPIPYGPGVPELTIFAPQTEGHMDIAPDQERVVVNVYDWYCFRKPSGEYNFDFAFGPAADTPYDLAKIMSNTWKEIKSGKEIIGTGHSGGKAYEKEFGAYVRSGAIHRFKGWADAFLARQSKDAVEFWSPNVKPPWKGELTLDYQGQTKTKSQDNCYTKAELEVMKQEAVRWANWIKKVYLPMVEAEKPKKKEE